MKSPQRRMRERRAGWRGSRSPAQLLWPSSSAHVGWDAMEGKTLCECVVR